MGKGGWLGGREVGRALTSLDPSLTEEGSRTGRAWWAHHFGTDIRSITTMVCVCVCEAVAAADASAVARRGRPLLLRELEERRPIADCAWAAAS